MDLAAMEAIATDLQGSVQDLTSRVGELEARGTDSFAPINTLYYDNVGVVKSTLEARESGYSILTGEREPEAGDFHAPGSLEWEMMDTANIVIDTIGATPEPSSIVELPGLFHSVPMPFRNVSPGILKLNIAALEIVPTIQERTPGSLWTAHFGCTGIELLRMVGVPGEKAKLKLIGPLGEVIGLECAAYNSKGEVLEAGGGGEFNPTFPADGILWVIVCNLTDASSIGLPKPPGKEVEVTYSKGRPAVAAIPTFQLFEGFLYNITSQWEFETDEQPTASGLFVVQADVKLLKTEVAQRFRSGEPYMIASEAAGKWRFRVAASLTIYVPEGQTEGGFAEGGTAILAQPETPGKATTLAWTEQTLTIQQIAFPS